MPSKDFTSKIAMTPEDAIGTLEAMNFAGPECYVWEMEVVSTEAPQSFCLGVLRLNDNQRWEIVPDHGDPRELSSGAVIDLHIGNRWIETRIEFGDEAYYSTTRGTQLVNNLTARIEL